MNNKTQPTVEIAHFSTLKHTERLWAENERLRGALLKIMDPEIHGTTLTVVCTLPEYEQVLVRLSADLTKREVTITFEHTDNRVMPTLLKYQQDEIRTQVLRKTIAHLKSKATASAMLKPKTELETLIDGFFSTKPK